MHQHRHFNDWKKSSKPKGSFSTLTELAPSDFCTPSLKWQLLSSRQSWFLSLPTIRFTFVQMAPLYCLAELSLCISNFNLLIVASSMALTRMSFGFINNLALFFSAFPINWEITSTFLVITTKTHSRKIKLCYFYTEIEKWWVQKKAMRYIANPTQNKTTLQLSSKHTTHF